MNLARRAYRVWKDQGPWGFWFRFLETLGYRRVQLWERNLSAMPPNRPVNHAASELMVTRLQAGEHDAWLHWRRDVTTEDFHQRIADGDRCWVARHLDQLIACAWVSTRHGRYLCDRFPLRAREAYLYDMFTDPAWRGRGVAGLLIERMAAQLKSEGFQSLMLAIYPENTAARRAYEKAGFRPRMLRMRFRLGKWYRDWTHTYRPLNNARTNWRATS